MLCITEAAGWWLGWMGSLFASDVLAADSPDYQLDGNLNEFCATDRGPGNGNRPNGPAVKPTAFCAAWTTCSVSCQPHADKRASVFCTVNW